MDEPFVLTSFAASSLPPTISAVGYTKAAKEDGRLLVSAIGVGVNLYDVGANFFSILLCVALQSAQIAGDVDGMLTRFSRALVGRSNYFGRSHSWKRISTDDHRRFSFFAPQFDRISEDQG